MPTDSSKSKRIVRYFLSYAHDDGKWPEKLLAELDKQLRACKDFEFKRWQDTDIDMAECLSSGQNSIFCLSVQTARQRFEEAEGDAERSL